RRQARFWKAIRRSSFGSRRRRRRRLLILRRCSPACSCSLRRGVRTWISVRARNRRQGWRQRV
ncbi:MAG: hypothetical protein ACK55Z_10565, partial [bacterium]